MVMLPGNSDARRHAKPVVNKQIRVETIVVKTVSEWLREQNSSVKRYGHYLIIDDKDNKFDHFLATDEG
jgi:hypothetical protein